jgi:quercetin dioxygenase-like cupin family protein
MMITRRRMLAGSATIAAIAAAKRAGAAASTGQTGGRNGTMAIIRNGSQPSSRGQRNISRAPFASTRCFQTPDPGRVTGGLVTFEPGERSNWHTHPCGETLIVISGLGWRQCWGEPKQEIRPGDVVWCLSGDKHWHGATAMSHIAIQEHNGDGKVVEWLERVSHEQYLK